MHPFAYFHVSIENTMEMNSSSLMKHRLRRLGVIKGDLPYECKGNCSCKDDGEALDFVTRSCRAL
jgi:hypothetical protein